MTQLVGNHMSISPREAYASAKRMRRTLESAPLPQDRARAIFTELAKADGWSQEQERHILAFGAWLNERPPPGSLGGACDQLLSKLN